MKKIIPIIKAETLIPEGSYCYSPVKAPCEETGWVYQVKVCPYWEPLLKTKSNLFKRIKLGLSERNRIWV
jgi:hypothetical protein